MSERIGADEATVKAWEEANRPPDHLAPFTYVDEGPVVDIPISTDRTDWFNDIGHEDLAAIAAWWNAQRADQTAPPSPPTGAAFDALERLVCADEEGET